jgi:hypothetical protein
MTESGKFILTLAATLVGSGIGTAIIGSLFKRRFDHQLETYKSFLVRNSQIHERQVDALLVIHSKLERALFYLQRVASAARFTGEATDNELLERMGRELAAASEEYSQKKLLLSPSLSKSLDDFFGEVVFANIDLGAALNPALPDGEPRAASWDKVRKVAYTRLPSILQSIAIEARAIIHSATSAM